MVIPKVECYPEAVAAELRAAYERGKAHAIVVPRRYLLFILLSTGGYLLFVELVKRRLMRRLVS